MDDAEKPDYTPALGSHSRTGDYDRVIAVMTRERRWRQQMMLALDANTGDTIVDIGSGTGSFAKQVLEACPGVNFIAVDPDPEVRRIAEKKTIGLNIEYVTALGDQPIESIPKGTVDHVTCSLVLHQCTMDAKLGILKNAYQLLRNGGRLLISDYGKQRSMLMSLLFNQVRHIDGYENTRANKDGLIPVILRQCKFQNVEELSMTQTPTGSISLYCAQKA